MSGVKPIPEGFHTATPFLMIRDVEKTLEFYEKGLGGKRTYVKKDPSGKVMHATVQIGDSPIMLAEEMPEHGSKAPGKDDERTSAVWLYVDDADAVFKRAVEAGGRAKQEPTDAFWGDRWAMVFDPSGQLWHIATHTEDVSEEEIDRRAQAFAHQSVSQQQTSNA